MRISSTARRLADAPRKGMALALDAPQQFTEVWQELAVLVRRAGGLLDRADLVLGRLEDKVADLEGLLERSDAIASNADRAASSTRHAAEAIDATRKQAEEEIGRLRGVLDLYQPVLQALAPLGNEAARTLRTSHVRGLARLLDEVPALVDRLAPALQGMADVPPQLENVSERMNDVGQVVEGLPGAKLLRRRGQEREESTS